MLLAPTASGVETVEQNLFPINFAGTLVLCLGLGLLLDLGLLLLFFLFFRLYQIQEGIVEELLLEVLLQIEQRHVEQVHRLVQARIDLELLPELSGLIKPRLHATAPSGFSREKRSRSRAVSVGPR